MESPKPEHAPAPTTPAASKRVTLITGASSGLGREFARQLDNLQVADELWLVARDQTALNAVASSLDTPARPLAADLTDPEAIERLRTECRASIASIGVSCPAHQRSTPRTSSLSIPTPIAHPFNGFPAG